MMCCAILSIFWLPCTFTGVSSPTAVAHAPYIADILTPYQIKALPQEHSNTFLF